MEMETGFSAHVEPETGFSALVETDRRFSALVETGFSALVETDRWFSALVETETRFCVSQSISSSIFVSSGYGSRLLTERAEVVGGLTAAAGAMPYQRPCVRLPRWAGCAAAEMH